MFYCSLAKCEHNNGTGMAFYGLVGLVLSVLLISVSNQQKCINVKKNLDEILKCCTVDDWLPDRDMQNCTNQHKFQFTESRKSLQFCVEACYYRTLGVVDEFVVNLTRIRELNAHRHQYEQEVINEAAFTCHEDKYEDIIDRLMRHRTECNSYPSLFGECIMNEIQMECHEKLWRNSTVCDLFRARQFC